MANNICFRGEINEMSAAYFCREMELLPSRSSASIYLNTPGGDIYAGGEMVNALRDACRRGCKFDITLGARCASMGASLLAAARANGARVHCHNNTEVMFHGCWSIVLGGADELTDQAKAMRDFNESVQRDLKRCGIGDTEEWFAADRMTFLNALELKSLGLVDDIIDGVAADPDLKQDALKIAAKYNHKESTMDELKNEVAEPAPIEAAPAAEETAAPVEAPVENPAPVEESKEEAPAAESVAEPAPVADDLEAKVADLANKRFAGLQAKHDKLISDLKDERDHALNDLAAANAQATSLKGEIEKLSADLAALRDQLAKSDAIRETIVTGALADDSEPRTYGDILRDAKATPEERIAAAHAEAKARLNNH